MRVWLLGVGSGFWPCRCLFPAWRGIHVSHSNRATLVFKFMRGDKFCACHLKSTPLPGLCRSAHRQIKTSSDIKVGSFWFFFFFFFNLSALLVHFGKKGEKKITKSQEMGQSLATVSLESQKCWELCAMTSPVTRPPSFWKCCDFNGETLLLAHMPAPNTHSK